MKGRRKFKLFCLVFSLVFIMQSTVFADDKINISLPVNTDESSNIAIENIELDGFLKTYDEKTGMYVFIPEAGNQQTYLDEAEKVELDIYDIEVLSKIDAEGVSTEALDDLETITEPSSDVMATAALPDLFLSSLQADSLIAQQPTKFNFIIGNLGESNANSVEIGVKLNGNLVGSFDVGTTIEAGYQYNAYFNLNGIPAGTHTVELIADYQNKITESNESNNSVSKTFTWTANTGSLPDLSIEILSPLTDKITGPTKETDTIEFKFRIRNLGSVATADRNFLVTVYADDSPAQRFYVSKINANSSVTGTFDMYFGAYKPTTLKFEVDSLNEITESNEKNNTDSRRYTPVYDMHKATSVFNAPSPGTNIKVQLKNNAIFSALSMDNYATALAGWNGITNKCAITEATVTDILKPDTQIFIYSDAEDVGNTLAYTQEYHSGGQTYIKIVLNDQRMSQRTPTENIRTVVHELGHAFTMGHPEDDGCKYNSVMYQSGYNSPPRTNEVTLHDMYGLYTVYENPRTYNFFESAHDISIYADVDTPISSLSELSNESEYIVKGKILPGSENVLTDYSGYTKTGFKIEEVYKGTLNKGDIIDIREPYYTSIYDENAVTTHREDYYASQVGEDYILFLYKQPKSGLYGLSYSTLSRYSLDDNETVKFDNSNNEIFSEKNYNQIKSEVLNTFK